MLFSHKLLNFFRHSAIIFFLPAVSFAQNAGAMQAFNRMMSSIRQTETCSFNLKLHERIKGKFIDSEYLVRLQAQPLKLYVYSVNPHPGAKALLIKNENDGKAYIHPNSFPYFNINLNPYHSILRKNHHFTMWEMGFGYVKELFDGYINKDAALFFKSLSFEHDVMLNGLMFDRLTISPPSFSYINYTVKDNETLTTIAKKLFINDAMILEVNPQLSGFNSVEEGDVIKVPEVLAKKIILYLDKKYMLPVIQEMHDEKGLFMRIEMSSLIHNPKFDNTEFTRTKKEYGF